MKVKEYKAPGTYQNIAVRYPSFSEKTTPGFILPIYRRPLHFTVTSYVDESFIVDWQLNGK